ncbi:acyl-CoA thioesterase [Piscinibacter sp.]|uniref:acyl-CoA thioesterase n=1 Tax=Piscinibacter sp. TaxID=1903157 RepID=UPI002B875B4B|nr:thioesterase family protein [Albitalea sp.]HUG21874.1 thioesterase family protein [Albitalea sp.]
MNLTPLSTLLARRIRGDGRTTFDVPDDWLQGRTSFGGLVSVFAVQAMRDAAGASWPAGVTLRALQTNFIAPVEAGALDVTVQVLREGRNIRQVQALVRQRDATCALMVGVFGTDRETTLAPLHPVRPVPARSIDDLPQHPFTAGRRPNFTAHLDMRWAEGGPPFSGSPDWQASIHLRLIDADDAVSAELMTVLMADVSPSPALSHFSAPAPASSVSWALELRRLPETETLGGWWRADNRVVAAEGGYVNQQSMLWSPGGTLAALAYQVVTVYG